MHGSGQRGSDNLAQVTQTSSILYPLLERREEYPCVVIAPQCPADGWWDAAQIMALLEHAKKEQPVDAARIYVTGLSMGGFATWELLAEYPDYFAAAAPICGGADPEIAPLIAHVPIWVFHGRWDFTVKTKYSRDMVKALEAIGGNVKYTEYPWEMHESWVKAYREPELFPWLFGQAR